MYARNQGRCYCSEPIWRHHLQALWRTSHRGLLSSHHCIDQYRSWRTNLPCTVFFISTRLVGICLTLWLNYSHDHSPAPPFPNQALQEQIMRLIRNLPPTQHRVTSWVCVLSLSLLWYDHRYASHTCFEANCARNRTTQQWLLLGRTNMQPNVRRWHPRWLSRLFKDAEIAVSRISDRHTHIRARAVHLHVSTFSLTMCSCLHSPSQPAHVYFHTHNLYKTSSIPCALVIVDMLTLETSTPVVI